MQVNPISGRERFHILVDVKMGPEELKAINKLANEWGWQLLDLGLMGGSVPAGIQLSGALISCMPDAPQARQLRAEGCPAVRLGRQPNPRDDLLPAVVFDQRAAGRMAAEHLVERQFKRLVFVGHDTAHEHADYHDMCRAFVDRARELGVAADAHDVFRPGEADETETARFSRRARELGEWLRPLRKPVGVFTFGDGMACRVLNMCIKEGFTVPEQIAILGCGNVPNYEMLPVPLASVDLASVKQAQEAMRLLRRLVSGQDVAATTVFIPPEGVVARRSTDVLAVEDPLVARTLRFIWEHVTEDLPVDRIAESMEVARRTLERAFCKELGRGVAAEMSRKRLEQFCHTLRHSDRPVREICFQMGYRSIESMCRRFRDATGTTPSVYRRQVRTAAPLNLPFPARDRSRQREQKSRAR